jgi:hydrogenase-4 component E
MKDLAGAYSAIDFISVGILLTAVAMNALKRVESCLRAYTLNSWLLALLVCAQAFITGGAHLYVASGLTLLSKGVAIPLFLRAIIRRMKATHEVEPYINSALSLAISGVLVAVVYASLKEGIFITGFSRHALQISLAVILIGLFVMITRRKAVTQVMGLLFMENGLFLSGFSLTYGMPMAIELGVLFDMLMGAIILGIFVVQIRRVFRSSDLDRLKVLKG